MATALFASVETITPERASAILEQNPDNRPIKPMLVDQFAADMRAGRWQLAGEPIIISACGHLNDGQHRLKAIISANTSVPMLIVRGVTRESRTVIDTGSTRTAGAILTMSGVANGNSLAVLAKWVLSWEGTSDQLSLGHRSRISKAQAIERGMADPLLQEAFLHGRKAENICKVTSAAFVYYALRGRPKIERFFELLASGAGLDTGHPVLTLRSWLIREGRRTPDSAVCEALFRGYSAFAEDRQLSRIQISGTFPNLWERRNA